MIGRWKLILSVRISLFVRSTEKDLFRFHSTIVLDVNGGFHQVKSEERICSLIAMDSIFSLQPFLHRFLYASSFYLDFVYSNQIYVIRGRFLIKCRQILFYLIVESFVGKSFSCCWHKRRDEKFPRSFCSHKNASRKYTLWINTLIYEKTRLLALKNCDGSQMND